MEIEKETYLVTAVPDKGMDRTLLFDAIGENAFSISYSLADGRAFLEIWGANAPYIIRNLVSELPGLSLDKIETRIETPRTRIGFSAFTNITQKERHPLSELALYASRGRVTMLFRPIIGEELSASKRYVERTLGSDVIRETVSTSPAIFAKWHSRSIQKENFDSSEERQLLSQMLESINHSVLRNGRAYKTYLICEDVEKSAEDRIKSGFLLMGRYILDQKGSLLDAARQMDSFPSGVDMAGNLVYLDAPGLNYVIKTREPRRTEGIEVGSFMKEGVSDTRACVSLEPSCINLGFIITGLPGSGKTREAMAIIDGVIRSSDKEHAPRPKMAIITPTDEWRGFSKSHGMHQVSLLDGATPINFFRCPAGVPKEKFYENLAMILSSASNAGPYRNPMEKCMLNAFRKVYSNTITPDPIETYDAIEEAIIALHGKRSSIGVKYTKHGENIRSALENLRAILSRPEYSVSQGVAMEDLFDTGVVLDLSNASNSTKPYLYALLLNQIYAISSSFGTDGDNKLNMLICLEESQLVFRDKEAASVQDIKYRIQDFRKQGIGLMLLTHNVNDIEPSIRRLCQIKLYLKQAPDVAPIAAKDLVFTYADEDQAIQKLKHLDSRVGAFSYMTKSGDNKLAQDTVFIRTKEYCENAMPGSLAQKRITMQGRAPCKVEIAGKAKDPMRLRIAFLGETIWESPILTNSPIEVELLEGRIHRFQLLNEKGRLLSEHVGPAKSTTTLPL